MAKTNAATSLRSPPMPMRDQPLGCRCFAPRVTQQPPSTSVTVMPREASFTRRYADSSPFPTSAAPLVAAAAVLEPLLDMLNTLGGDAAAGGCGNGTHATRGVQGTMAWRGGGGPGEALRARWAACAARAAAVD